MLRLSEGYEPEEDSGIEEDEEEEFSEEGIIPPSSVLVRPVLSQIPPSFPQWKTLSEEIQDSLKVRKDKTETERAKYKVPVGYFVEDRKVESLGRIVQTATGGSSASQYQYVFVEAKRGALEKGQKLLVIMPQETVMFRSKTYRRAQVYEVQGYVEIIDEVEPERKYRSSKRTYYKALVLGGLSLVLRGGILVDEEVEFVTSTTEGTATDVVAKVIGGELSQGRKILAKDAVVYLDKGARHGLKEGNILAVQNSLSDGRIIKRTGDQKGYIKLARVANRFSTGVIVGAKMEIRLGDIASGRLATSFLRESVDSDF